MEGYQDMIRAVEAISPVPIELEEIAGDSKGYYDREAKRIAVQENMSESQTLKTMIHEVAHSKLHSKEVEQDEQMKKTAIPKRWKRRVWHTSFVSILV